MIGYHNSDRVWSYDLFQLNEIRVPFGANSVNCSLLDFLDRINILNVVGTPNECTTLKIKPDSSGDSQLL